VDDPGMCVLTIELRSF